MRIYHVFLKENAWTVIRSGSELESDHATEESAIAYASQLAQITMGQVICHGMMERSEKVEVASQSEH